jgi:uridine kinase
MKRTNKSSPDSISLETVIAEIQQRRDRADPNTSLLVGISGIDASGKGYVTDRIVQDLIGYGTRTVAVHGDGWLNLPHTRFNSHDPGQHFYDNALRLNEMFNSMVLPLKRHRSHTGIMKFAQETATEFRRLSYSFEDIDVIVLECIFLFQRRFQDHFDIKIWIECSFETALRRAISRGQEGLSATDTIRAYEQIYFPAQKIHLAKDNPRAMAHWIIDNDS